MILLLDIGNTCIKWAQLLDGRLTPQQSLVHRDVEPQVWMKELFRERFRPSRLLVANVAGSQMQQRIAQEARRLWQIETQFASTAAFAAGVTHAYREVSSHGVDRWLAVIAAYRLAGGAACVIDAGTAATIDGVDSKGLHLGGLILPGVRMMIDSLLNKTGDIAKRARALPGTVGTDISGSGTLFATATAQAVATGAVLAIAAASDRAIAEVAKRTGASPKVYLTGGDAPSIARAMQTSAEQVPDLVLQGLSLLAQTP
jgi:type III pantothenate kinase